VDIPGRFYGWDLFLVFISMSANLQAIPLGLIAIQPYIDVIAVEGTFSQDEFGLSSSYQDDNFENPPSVFIDGLLLTYKVSTDRRYVEFNSESKIIYIKNGIVQLGEVVQIFL
jgi:hypothetical protein